MGTLFQRLNKTTHTLHSIRIIIENADFRQDFNG